MYRYLILVLTTILLFGCDSNSESEQRSNLHQAAFQKLLDQHQVQGAILIYDAQKKTYYANDYQWATQGYLPASTFKIPHTLIALETETVKGDTSLFKWDGKARDFPAWEKDLNFQEAFTLSCVPCFQEIARKIGFKQMKTYINKLHYPTMVFTEENLDSFWLQGESRITLFEQIDFLNRLYTKRLPVLNVNREKLLAMMRIEQTASYSFYGKTGLSDSAKGNNGWMVGLLTLGNKVYYYALNIEPKASSNSSSFPASREKIVRQAFQQLNLM